jgi:hypothetical protein
MSLHSERAFLSPRKIAKSTIERLPFYVLHVLYVFFRGEW